MLYVYIGERDDEYNYCQFSNYSFGDRVRYVCWPRFHYNHQMARGLYCLGIEDKTVIAQLDSPLTAHEKLELRLSMPREFWPQKWLDGVRGEV